MTRFAARGAAALLLGIVLFGSGRAAAASLASTAYSILRWLDGADLVHHAIEATIDFEKQEAVFADEALFISEGKRTLHFLLGVDARLDQVEWIDGEEVRPLATGITLRWDAIPFTVYRVRLPQGVPAGEAFRLRFHWRITPESVRFLSPFAAPGFFYLGYALLWYPQMPDEDFFTATLSVTAPEGYTVVADGEPGEPVREGGRERHSFRVDVPVNRLGIGAGRFDRHEAIVHGQDGRALRVEAFAPAGAGGSVGEAAQYTARAVRFFEERLGPLPLSRFYVAEFPFEWAQSYSSLHGLVYGGDIAFLGLGGPGGLALLAAHETAHKWLGGIAGSRVVGSAWVFEGLAEYLGQLALERLIGPEEAAVLLERRVLQPFVTKLRSGSGRPLDAIEVFDADAQWLFEKGSLVFRMLHHLLGDEAFFDLLREFFAEYEGRHASAGDFTRFAVTWAGSRQLPVTARELDRFFATWARGTGVLDYAVEQVSVAPREDGFEVRFQVANRGAAEFPGSVPVRVLTAGGGETWLEVRSGAFVTAVLDAPPVEIRVDPRRILADADPANNVWSVGVQSLL